MTVPRFLLATLLVTVSFIAGRLSVGSDVVDAQGISKPTVVKRIYTGTDGLSHVEDLPLKANDILE